MSVRKKVSSGSPYEPIVGFSRAVRIGNVIAVSGTGPLGPDGKTVPGDVAAQARRCFEISIAALEQLGAGASDIIRTRMMLTRIEDWEAAARAHGEFFGKIRPASTIMQVTALVESDWLIETEVDAVIA
ncbi:MAG: RidA family protein [Xanthomonadales bacterium]|nr:RidA family protein [Gammaproteobacteria bacterium]MBT8053823.1 RidA family protein [Gammaproteobacteria bacterium]NND56567.1 RidA family protein [Xanthomonadales bacterium]NNK52534.1 RidA family protein [Xanthomonadales bacterium]